MGNLGCGLVERLQFSRFTQGISLVCGQRAAIQYTLFQFIYAFDLFIHLAMIVLCDSCFRAVKVATIRDEMDGKSAKKSKLIPFWNDILIYRFLQNRFRRIHYCI